MLLGGDRDVINTPHSEATLYFGLKASAFSIGAGMGTFHAGLVLL